MLYFTSREVTPANDTSLNTNLTKSPDDLVRLKYFLARRTEGKFVGEEGVETLAEHQVAFLAFLYFWPEISLTLTQEQIADALHILAVRNVLPALRRQKLVSPKGEPLKITEPGIRRLAQYADDVLGIPSDVSDELNADDNFKLMMTLADKTIDAYLDQKIAGIIPSPPKRETRK